MLPGFNDIITGWHGIVPALALGIIIPTVRSILAKKAPAPKAPPGIPRAPLAGGKQVWNGPSSGRPKRWGVPAGAKKKLPFPLKKREKDDTVRHLRSFFRHEVRRYKRVVGGTQHIYDTPWFLLVGESGSGKTTLVDASPQYPWSAQYAEIYPGESLCAWWCSDRAVVLDVSGDLLLRADGSSSVKGWRTLMRLLRRYRYQRPIDGVIVTIPATELAGPERLASDDLALKGAAILGKLREIERMLGMQVPVYMVVTKCDALPGFRSFCELLPERRRDEMFGWSNPYTREAGYSSQWVEEAFHTMASVLSTAQLEILSELPAGADGDDLFLFPSAFAGLLEGTREYANQMFRPTGSERTPLLMRGIYFTGDAAAEEGGGIAPADDDAASPEVLAKTVFPSGDDPAPGAPAANGANGTHPNGAHANGAAPQAGETVEMVPSRMLCFVGRLFETKIFPEYTIAYPFREGGLAKNRMKLGLQLSVALVCLLGLLGVVVEYPRLERSEDEIHEVLETMTGNLDKVRDGRGVAAADHVRFAEQLLDGLYTIDSSRMISALYPSSWVSPLHDEIHHAMVAAYDTIIIKAMCSQLEEKTRQLSRYRVLRGSTGGASSYAIENTDEFRRLREFVDELSGIEQHGTMFNNLRRTRRLQDVMELVSYLFGRELPPDFLQKAEYYRHTLQYNDTVRFDPAPYGNDLTTTAEVLLARLRDKVFLQNAILNYVQSINNSIAELARRNGNGFESVEMMANLRVRIEALKRALLDPSTAWISSKSFEADTSLKKLMTDLDKSSYIRRNGESVKLGTEFLRSSDSIFQELREKIGNERSDVLASTIVATEPVSGVFMLAPATDTLHEAIGTLVGQPFMRARTRGSISYRRGRGNLVLWNAAQLGNAASLENSYNTFVDAGLPRFPERLQMVAGNTARYGMEGTMVGMIDPAQRAETSAGELDDIGREIENLQAASPVFDQILSIFDRLQLSSYDAMRSVLRMQGDAVLEDLTRLRDRMGLYAVGDDRFIRFAAVVASDNQQQRAGETLLDAPDDAALAERVGLWHEQIKELATSAADLMLAFLSKMGGSRSGPRMEWQKIVSELHRYDDRVPKNSVSAVEDLFMDLNNITEENYRERLVKRSVGDYFLARRETFRQRLYDIYDRAIINRVRQRYDTLRRVFNDELLYHFPFADAGDTLIRRSVPPEDLYNWFRMLDRFVTRDRSVWLRWNDANLDEGYRAAYRFILTMSDVRDFMAPLLREDSENPPELLFDVEFRANVQKEVEARNIIDWRLKIGEQVLTIQEAVRQGGPLRATWKPGERIQLSLRWAKNSALIPHTVTRGRGMIQSDSHTVVYLFNDPHWALLRLLAAHRAPAANVTRNSQPQMLEFSVLPMWKVWTTDDVPVNRNQSPEQSRAYIRVGVLSQNRKESLPVPVFPTTEAPALPPLRPVQ